MYRGSRKGLENLLQQARSEADVAKLKLAKEYYEMHAVCCMGRRTDVIGSLASDVLVDIAEVAYELKQCEIGLECVSRYLESKPSESMFYVRCYYAKGLLESLECPSLKGRPLIDRTLLSLQSIRKGMEVAVRKKDKFGFLVYNGSIHIWNVSRYLSFQSVRANLVAVLQDTIKSLDDVQDTHVEWKLRLMLQLGLALVEAGKADEASKLSLTALDLCNKQCASFKRNVLYGCIEINKSNPAVVTKLKSEATTAPLKLAYSSQVLRSLVLKDRKAAETELNEAVSVALKTLAEPAISSTAKTASDGRNADVWDTCSELLRATIQPGYVFAAQAQQLLDSVLKSSTALRARTSVEAVQAVIPVVELDDFLAEANVNARSSALKKLEKALQSASRSGDRLLVEYCAVWIWNIGMHLLQNNTRNMCYRPFLLAAQELEKVESELHVLRVKLHYEIARCEIVTDTLAKAATQVKTALALDYVVDEATRKAYELDRPYDRYLVPLENVLQLRTNVYKNPDSLEDQLELLLDQVRESKFPNTRKSLLERTLAILESGLEAEKFAISQGRLVQTAEEAKKTRKRRAYVYADMIRSAWVGESMRFPHIVNAVFPLLLAEFDSWDAVQHKELRLDMVRCCYIMADAAVFSLTDEFAGEVGLNDYDFTTIPPNEQPPAVAQAGAATGEAEAELVDPEQAALEQNVRDRVTFVQREVEKFIVQGLEMAVQLADETSVVNGAVAFYNHHLQMIRLTRTLHIEPLMLKVFHALDAVFGVLMNAAGATGAATKDAKDKGKDKAATEKPSAVKPPVSDELIASLIRTGSSVMRLLIKKHCKGKELMAAFETPADSPELKQSLEICEKVKARFAEAGRGTIMQIRDVIALEARTKRLAGVKTADGKGPEETLVAISELLSSPLKKEESEALIKKAQDQTAILTKQGTKLPVEPCVLIAVHCLQLGFPRAALDLATQVVGLLTDTEGVSAKKWRWFGTAERVCGQSLVLQIDPQRLEKRAQDAIRSEALDHLSKACEYLTRSPLLTTAVMLDTLQVFLWAVGPFMASPVTKQLAIPFLQRVCAVASGFFSETKHAVKGLEPGSIILQLFVSMVDALYASMPFAEDPSAVNSESEDWCTKGLLCVPRKLHKKLIEFAVRCASSSSRRKWMSRIKEYDPETQARAWTTVARIADTRAEQREAFLHAIGLMQEPASKAEFLVEYAIWRFFNNFPVREALDTLLYTVDLLTEKDQQADIESAANTPRSDSKSTLSKRSRNTALSRHSGVSRASSKGSKLSVRSSNRSMVMKAIVADIEQDMGLSCVEVELLARTLVSLAVLSESSSEKLHYAKMAVHQYSRLFHTSARFLNQLVDAAARDKTVAAAVGAGQQKLQFPSALSSWIDFSLVPAIMDRLLGSTSLYVLNSRSIRQPQLTIAFLQLLMRLLSSLGYLLHQVPLYTVAIFIAEKLLQDHVLTAVLKSGLLRLLQTLGKASAMPELPAEVAKAHASWELSSKDKRIAIQEVQQFAQISASRSKVTIKDDERKSTVSEAASQASPYIQDVLQPRSVRHTWILEAQELLRCGQWISASGVALEIANHATIFKEYATLSESLRLLGQVQMAENDHDGAVANLRKAMEGARFTVDVWADVLIACADALWLQEKSIHAITCLRDGIRVVAEFASRPLNAIAEAKLALSRLSLHLCCLMFASIKHRLSRPDASMMSDLETIRFYLKTASVNATAYGYCPHMYELAAFTIDFERSLAEGLSSPLERRSALQSLLRSFDAAFVSSCFAVYKDIRCADPMVAIDFPVASLIANVLLDIAEVELQLFCLEQANHVLIERMETPFFPSSTFQQDDTKVREFLKHSMLEDGLPPIVDDTRWERVYHSALSAASLTPSPSVQSRAFLLCGASICWHAYYSLGLQSPSDDLPTDLQEELSRCRQTAGKFLHDCLRISVDHQFWMHASRASVCLSLLDADKAVGFSFQAVGFRSAAEAAEAVASVSHRTSASGVTVPNVARMVANPNSAAFDFDALKSSLPPVLANDVTHVCIIPPFRDQIHVLCGVIHKGQSYIEYVDVDPSRLTSAMNDMTALFDEMVPDALAQGQCIANCASTADEQLMRPILDSLTMRLPAETTDVKPKIRLSLLCPPSLQVLPYELTPSVSSNCSSVIRDFSLAMLVARHQGLSKLTAPRAAASFLIDDRKEAEGLTRMVRTSVVEPSASSITKEWKTVSGETDRLIGASEWMNVLSAPTSRMVLHVGLERLLMLTGARPLLDIDFQHNELFFNVECTSSESSLERRKLYYNTVSAIRRVAQSPIHLALYLSLAGTCNYVTTPAGVSKEDAVAVMQQMLKLAPAEPTLDMASLLAKSVSASIPDPQQPQQPWFVMFGTTIPGFVTAPEPAPAKGAKK